MAAVAVVLAVAAQVADGNNGENDMKIMRSSVPRWFFSKREKRQIEESIQRAELHTSGEVRVHLERAVKGDMLAHTKDVFEKLGMTATEARNGVLVFFAVKSRRFAIVGDTGINEKVPDTFWDDIVVRMQEKFAQNLFAEGLIEGIELIGHKLQDYFPYQTDDVNELPDAISFGF